MANPLPPTSDGPPAPTAANTAAVVVTYQPPEDSLGSLAPLRDQVARIILVDNGSPPAVRERLSRLALADGRITLIANPENLGIAQALNQGCQEAANLGLKWALLLDQDSLVTNCIIESLAGLHAHARADPSSPPVAILAANYRDATGRVAVQFSNGESDTTKRPGARVLMAITSGSLLNLDAFNTIGLFRSDFFIDEVDHEFCLRAHRRGYSVWLVREVGLDHRLGDQQRMKLGAWHPAVSHHSAIRRYYMARNRVALFKQYIAFAPGFVIGRLALTGAEAAGVVLLERDKLAKLLAMARGVSDGLLGRMGPRRASR